MADEKYIKIDPVTGKASTINKDEGQKIKGVPPDDDLCFIEFKDTKFNEVVDDDETGGKKVLEVPGIEFTCSPTEKCKQKNKETNDRKEKLRADIAAQQKIIDDQTKLIGDHKQKAQEKKQAKTKKEEAEDKKRELERELRKFKPQCYLKYAIGPGGDDKVKNDGDSDRLKLDDIKKKKIEHVYCKCEKVEAPQPPQKK